MSDPNVSQNGKSSKALVPRKPKGRPVLLTPELMEEICKDIKGGSFVQAAVAKAGISTSTYYDWLRQGARERRAGIEDSLYVAFSEAVKKADGFAENRLTHHASKAAETNHMAAFILLERRWPQRWRRPTDDRENKRATMEAVLKAVIDTVRLVREAAPGLTDEQLIEHVFDNIELPHEDAPEPTGPREAAAEAPPIRRAPPAVGPIIDAEIVEPTDLEERRAKGAEAVLKESK